MKKTTTTEYNQVNTSLTIYLTKKSNFLRSVEIVSNVNAENMEMF